MEELKREPSDKQRPPEVQYQGEYWPAADGPGTKQLAKSQGAKRRDLELNSSSVTSHKQEESGQQDSLLANGFVKRADRSDGEICAYGDECYPYPYPMTDMYDWYQQATW